MVADDKNWLQSTFSTFKQFENFDHVSPLSVYGWVGLGLALGSDVSVELFVRPMRPTPYFVSQALEKKTGQCSN